MYTVNKRNGQVMAEFKTLAEAREYYERIESKQLTGVYIQYPKPELVTPENVEPGDRVRDPLDGEVRTVDHIEGTSVYMTDGGVMGLDECREIYLPSEDIPGSVSA